MRLGISTFTFGWAVGVSGSEPPQPMDENGLLDVAEELGVHVVQIGDNLPLNVFSESRLAGLHSRAKAANTRIEVGARELTPRNLETYVAIAQQLDASVLRFVIDRGDYLPSPAQVTRILREAAPLLGGGLMIGLENHDRFSAKTLRQIIEDIGDPNIGICLDTANSYGLGEGWRQVAEILAPYVVNLHVKDFAAERLVHQMGFTIGGRPAGNGLIDIPWLVELIGSYGRCESAILELWTPPEATVQQSIAKERAWAVRSVEYLSQFLET